MKYYKNYVLKILTDEQIKTLSHVFINNEPLIIPYEFNKKLYWFRIDKF